MTIVRRAGIPVLLAIVLLAGACGSSTNPTAKAQGDAERACLGLLTLGGAVNQGSSVLSSAAEKTLDSAHTEADEAYALDRRWYNLAVTVRTVRNGLLLNKRQGLSGSLDDLVVYCKPALHPPSSSVA